MEAVFAGFYTEGDDNYYVLYDPDAGENCSAVMVLNEDAKDEHPFFDPFPAIGKSFSVDADFFQNCPTRESAPAQALQVIAEFED